MFLVPYILGNVYFSWATVSALAVPRMSCSQLCFIVIVLLLTSHRARKWYYGVCSGSCW